jgi:hypothetical protein
MNATATRRRLFQPESRLSTAAWFVAWLVVSIFWWTMTLAPLVLFLGTILG